MSKPKVKEWRRSDEYGDDFRLILGEIAPEDALERIHVPSLVGDESDADARLAILRSGFAEHHAWVTDRERRRQTLNTSEGADLRRTIKDNPFGAVDFPGAKLSGLTLGYAHLRRKDFQEAELQQTNFKGADLRRTDLRWADLRKAKLDRADLRGANLKGARLQRSKLSNTRLEGANLTNANLRGAKGLMARRLAGTDVTNAVLPSEIARFDALQHAAHLSQHARVLFLFCIAACFFVWTTCLATSDAHLLGKATSTLIPLIDVSISPLHFFLLIPFVLVVLYVYLHVYLLRLWEAMAGLPAVLVDGRRLDEHIYPWLLTSLAGRYVPRLRAMREGDRNESPLSSATLSGVQEMLAIMSAWFVIPVTLLAIWMRCLPAMSPVLSVVQATAVVIAVLLGAVFFCHMRRILRLADVMEGGESKLLDSASPDTPDLTQSATPETSGALHRVKLAANAGLVAVMEWSGQPITPWALAGGTALLLAVGTDAVSNGAASFDIKRANKICKPTRTVRPDSLCALLEPEGYGVVRRMVVKKVRFWRSAFPNVGGLQVTTRPDNWFDSVPPRSNGVLDRVQRRARAIPEIDRYRGNLKYLRAGGAFLANMKLNSADMRFSSLLGADLTAVRLVDADLRGADLSEAWLAVANLKQARFEFADLDGAWLGGVLATGANFSYAEMDAARFEDADLTRAKFVGTRLRHAVFDGAILEHASFVGADLRGANLAGVDSKLNESRFEGACVDGDTDWPVGFDVEKIPDVRVRPKGERCATYVSN